MPRAFASGAGEPRRTDEPVQGARRHAHDQAATHRCRAHRSADGRGGAGAEHLLLSSIGLPDGSAARALAAVGVDADRIHAALREEQAEALVTAGVPREMAKAMAEPEPLGPAGAPLLYGAGPSAREAFGEAGRMARSARRRLAGAHVVAAVAGMERGTVARVFDRLGVDRRRLADAARVELGER